MKFNLTLYRYTLKALLVVVFSFFGVASTVNASTSLPIIKGIGGDFTLNNSRHTESKLSDYEGKVVLLFFGYTNCADICPTTLGYSSSMIKGLDQKTQENLQVLFVSIDPEYDTPEHLRKYLAYFDERFVGLTGTKEQIDHVIGLFQSRYNQVVDGLVTTEHQKFKIDKDGVKREEDKSHLYTHSSSIFLIDTKGRTRTAYSTGTNAATVQDAIVSLLEDKPMPSHVEGEGMHAKKVMNGLSYPAGVSVHNAWVREVPEVGRSTAAYMEIENFSDNDVSLVTVSSAIAKTSEVHENYEIDGMMTMHPIGELQIAAHSTVTFSPTGLHIMMMGLKGAAPKAGDLVSLTLSFGNGESLVVDVPVQKQMGMNAEHNH